MENRINAPNSDSIKYFLSFFQSGDPSKPPQLLSVEKKQYHYEILVGNGFFNSQPKNLEQYFGGLVCKVEAVPGTQNTKVFVSHVQVPTYYPVNSFLKQLHQEQGKHISLGIGNFGEEVLDLDSITHMGLYGATGFGKSSFMKYLISQVLAYRPDVDNLFFDPKGTEFESFKHHPRTIKVGGSMDEKFSLIMALKTEMMVREHFFTSGFKMVPSSLKEYLKFREDYKRSDLPVFNKMFVWIDEAHEFSGIHDSSYVSLSDALTNLVFKARSFGIHFIFSTQLPNYALNSLKRQVNTILSFAVDNPTVVLDASPGTSIPYIAGRILKFDMSTKKGDFLQVPYTTTEDSLRIAYGGWETSKAKSKAIGFYPLKVDRKVFESGEIFGRIVRGMKLKELMSVVPEERGNYRFSIKDFKFCWPEIYDLYDGPSTAITPATSKTPEASTEEIGDIFEQFENLVGPSPAKTPEETTKEKEREKRLKTMIESAPPPAPKPPEKVLPKELVRLEAVALSDNHPELSRFVKEYKTALRESRSNFDFCLMDVSKNVGLVQLIGFLKGKTTSSFVPEGTDLALNEELEEKFNEYVGQARYATQRGAVAPLLIVAGKKGMGKRTLAEVLGRELMIEVRDSNPSDLYGNPSKSEAGRLEVIVFKETMDAITFCRQGVPNKVPVLLFEVKESVETLFGMMKPQQPDFQYLNINHTFLNIPDNHYQNEGVAQKLINSILKKFRYKAEVLSPYEFARHRIKMTPFHLNAVLERAKQRADFGNKKLSRKLLDATLVETAKNISISNSNVRVIAPKVGLEGLVVPKNHREELEQIIHRAKSMRSNKFKFVKNLRTGNRVVALFAGPPGTGKSMSAEVIAKELGVECWQADFSRLQGKYVGESEKLFSEVFEQAEACRAVLLIDECDAFLNRQGDSDYSRKMANHFLNLINNFQGILILTTNFARDLDGAFNRRIDFKVMFKYPEKPQMIEILKKLLLPDAPIEGPWDWEKLVEGISLSGGLLLNAVEKAVLLMEKNQMEKLTFETMRQALEETQKGNDVVEERKRTIGFAS